MILNYKINKENHYITFCKSNKLDLISKSIENSDKVEIKPSQIDLSKEINKIGFYDVKINLHAEILATIHIEVVKEEEKK